MAPAKLKRWLIVIAVVYLLLPRDLIPDFLGRGLGLIDDLALIGLLTHLYRRHLRASVAGGSPYGAGGPGPSQPNGRTESTGQAQRGARPARATDGTRAA